MPADERAISRRIYDVAIQTLVSRRTAVNTAVITLHEELKATRKEFSPDIDAIEQYYEEETQRLAVIRHICDTFLIPLDQRISILETQRKELGDFNA